MDNLKRISRWLVASLLLSVGLTAQAAPINFSLLDEPLIFSSFMNLTYDSGFNQFDVTGTSFMQLDGVMVTAPNFSLNAEIGDNGNLSLGGTLSITGNSSTLLTGKLLGFGFNEINETLEFTFQADGGDLLSTYNTMTSGLGGIIIADTGYNGHFLSGHANYDTDFSITGYTVSANIAPVPVPAAVWLFGSGLLGLAGIARRRV